VPLRVAFEFDRVKGSARTRAWSAWFSISRQWAPSRRLERPRARIDQPDETNLGLRVERQLFNPIEPGHRRREHLDAGPT